MNTDKRSVNGRLIPITAITEVSYLNHLILINFTEVVENTVPSGPSAPTTITDTNDEVSSVKEKVAKKSAKTTGSSTDSAPTLPPTLNNDNTGITQTINVQRSYIIPVAIDGAFEFMIPSDEVVLGNINFKVVKPGGGVLEEKEITYAGLNSITDPGVAEDESAELTIQVDPYQPLILTPTTNSTPYKVTGRVIAFETGEPLKNWTIFINVLFKDASSGTQPHVIEAIKTDTSGYFSFHIAPDKLSSAFVKIAGLASETFPLSLSTEDSINPSQIIVIGSIDDIDTDLAAEDCACNGSGTPALPDAEDLVNSGAYSDDLGGSCVDFTTPNRSLEEFNYYSIIRTTEPEIKRVPYKKPPLLVIGDLEQAQNAPVVANGLAFDKEVAKWGEKHTKEIEMLLAFWGHMDGWNQFHNSLANGDMKWWLFESSILTYIGTTSQTFPGMQSTGTLNTSKEMLEWISNNEGIESDEFFEYFCLNKAKEGYKQFYGKIAPSNNDAYAFWYFAASKYFEQHGVLPAEPETLEFYIAHVLTKTGGSGPAEWWLFYIDYNQYHAPGGLSPLEFLKKELTIVFTQINLREPQLEAELLEFLKMAINYFKEDYDRIPNTPEEIFSYITATFSGDSKSRLQLTGHHAIDWDDTPVLHHNTTISHGHILNFKQVWKADGYSLGDLLYSLPLAPCQKKQIAIFDWDRNEAAHRGEQVDVSESMNAYLGRDRDVTDIISSSLTENTKGGSEAESSGSSFGVGKSSGAGAAGSGSYGPFSLGVAGGSSQSLGGQTSSGSGSSSAWQDSARNVSANSLSNLRDRVMQSASSVRSQRATVVQAVNQNESVSVQTDSVANHNHCHSMTVEYFEVLRHFAIEQQLADVQECLFVPLDITPFTIYKILRWKNELARAVGKGELQKGFKALDTIKNKYMVEGTGPVTIMADEEILELNGMLEFNIIIDRPPDIVEVVADTVKTTFDDVAWALFGWLPGMKRASEIKSNFEGKTQEQKEKIYRDEILPDILAGFIQQLQFGYEDKDGVERPIYFDVTVVPGDEDATRYMSTRSYSYSKSKMRTAIKDNGNGGELRLFLRHLPSRGSSAVRRSDVSRFYIKNPWALPANSRVLFNGGYINYESASLKETLFSKQGYYDDIDTNDSVLFSTNLNARELENPIRKNYDDANALITHLNDHLEYYHKTIWWQMDPDKRFMMLDGFIAPNSGNKSVASVVENKLISIVGNNLVFPVVRGVHLDPTYSQINDEPIDLFSHYAPTTPLAPFRLSVPTRGVYAEAVMGQCNSCEIMDESRHWRFSEVPCGDSPTPIQPISLDSRRSDPGNLQTKDLAPNIVNFQNVPNAPDPQGFNEDLRVLSTPGIFENVTGLTENQKNALAALQANQKGVIDAMQMNVDAAQAYAEMAKELVTQEQMLKHGDKINRNAEQQQKKGNATQEDVKKTADMVRNLQMTGKANNDIVPTSDNDKPDKLVNVSPTQALLPDNPAMFASYSATGENGESVEYTTSDDVQDDDIDAQIDTDDEISGGYEMKGNLLKKGVIWKGFRHQWVRVNHRTNRLGDIIVPSTDYSTSNISNSVELIHTGASGSAPDALKHESFFSEIDSQHVKFYAGVDQISDLGKINGHFVSRTLQISGDLPSSMQNPNEDLHLFLNGFDIYSDGKIPSRKVIKLKIDAKDVVRYQNNTKFHASFGIELLLECKTAECYYFESTETAGKYNYSLRIGYLIASANASDLNVKDIPSQNTERNLNVPFNPSNLVEIKSKNDIIEPTSSSLLNTPDPLYEVKDDEIIQESLLDNVQTTLPNNACTAVRSIEFVNDLTTHQSGHAAMLGSGGHAFGHTLEMNAAIINESIVGNNIESTQELFFKNWHHDMGTYNLFSFKSGGTAYMNMELSMLRFNTPTSINNISSASIHGPIAPINRDDFKIEDNIDEALKTQYDGTQINIWLGKNRSAAGKDAITTTSHSL